MVGPILTLRAQDRRGSQIPTRRADWLAACCSRRHRATLSRSSARSWCCNRSTAATCAVDQFTGNFRVELDQRAEEPVNVVQVVVGPTGFVGAPEQAVVDYIRSTFVDRPKPDLIVTVAGPAAVFARKYRQQLFPDTPLLFASVDQRYLGDAPLGENETAVAVVNDFPRVIEDILQLLPQTRQVFMVMGSGQIGQFWRRELEDAVQAISRPADICLVRRSVPSGDPAPLCEPARQLGDLLFHVRHGRGGGGVCGRASVRRPSRHGQCAPVCGAERVPRRRHRRRIADVHRRPRSQHGRRGRSTLERRAAGQHQRAAAAPRATDIRLARVASGGASPRAGCRQAASCAIALRACGSAYRGTVLERRRRAGRPIAPDRRAPVPAPRTASGPRCDSRRNLALAADASRRQTMSALTSSIAHELGQPLSSMIHNAQARSDDDHRQSCDARHDGRDPVRHRDARASRPHRSSIGIGPCSEVINWTRNRSTFTP